ncbi:hypothetical protein AVEN_191191-1 [Araneus ventricosus]|uniref:Uncharacterized protein n=1 Tax=Araneus ventricosus TaxID=182803 RepID=A0A4Y2EVC3_ARAVE|nr:hypothetical protein AVEN_191191-1 [Araneus ventricosus]
MTSKHPSSPVTKKFKVSHSAGKVVLKAFWDAKGVILIDFVTFGTINAARSCDTFTKLMSAIQRKRPGLLSRGVLFLDDNAIAGHRFLPGWILEVDFTIQQIYQYPWSNAIASHKRAILGILKGRNPRDGAWRSSNRSRTSYPSLPEDGDKASRWKKSISGPSCINSMFCCNVAGTPCVSIFVIFID